MTSKRLFLFGLVFHFIIFTGFSQSYFKHVEIITDTSSFNSVSNSIIVNNTKRTYFYYKESNQVAEVRLYPVNTESRFELLPSIDFEVIDSMLCTGNFCRFKVRFGNLNRSELLRFTIQIDTDSLTTFEEVMLQPLSNTKVNLNISDNEVFIGEEKQYEVFSNNADNLNISEEWQRTDNFDYRYSANQGKVFLNLVPKKLGRQTLQAKMTVRKPHLIRNNQLIYTTEPILLDFVVKASRLQYLNLDKSEITLSETTQEVGIEVQLDNHRLLEMNKTYRIEAQEVAGGTLVAELFTKQRLGNDKVLCILRPYNYHRSATGYLYIKDGDSPKFISNFSITPATEINEIQVLYEGNQWRTSNVVRPGEVFDIKLVGEGMHKSKFYFEDLIVVQTDTLVRTENQQVFRLKVPVDINKSTINIYNHSELTGKTLKVSEFQRPRDFDYIFVDYGERAKRVSQLKEPMLYEGIVKDMVISFNRSLIDEAELHGKQYLNLEVRITGKEDELIELKRIENITVCPSGKSPRADKYSGFDCFNGNLSLNKYIRKETSDLDAWSRINVTISHNTNKYNTLGYEKEVEVILKRRTSFDIELSFPAGLITISKQDNDSIGFGSLSGISLAMIGQFSFYHPEKINRYRPYKIGAGFLALNAFNFADDAENRDVGLVIIGSLYPTTRDTKLTFPLYVGGGYFIKDQKWFFLIGPGIRLKL